MMSRTNATINNTTTEPIKSNILISVRGENYNKIMLNDVRLKYNVGTNPEDIANEFIRNNKITNATIYINELKTSYKMGSLVFEDIELAEQNSEIYGAKYEKVVTVNTIRKINV